MFSKVFIIFEIFLCVVIVQSVEISPVHVSEDETNSRLFESLINEFVECIREKMKQGIPSLWIKSLDPLVIPIPIPLCFDNGLLRGRLLLRKFRLDGLAGFNLTQGTVSVTQRVQIGFHFPKIRFTAKYNAELTLFESIKVYGTGKMRYIGSNRNVVIGCFFSLEFNGFDIKGDVRMRLPPQIRSIKIKLVLPSTNANIEGLFDDEHKSKIISQQVAITLTTLAKQEETKVNNMVNLIANDLKDNLLNPILKNLSISDIVAIIKSVANCNKYTNNVVEISRLVMNLLGINFDETSNEKSFKIIKCI